jgi:hypothetical protein
MDQKILTELSNELSLCSRALDSAGEQHSDRDLGYIAYRLRCWVSQIDCALEGTETQQQRLHDQATE